MTELEAIKARHAVRKYSDKPIEAEKIAHLKAAVERLNEESGLHVQLVLDEPKAFSSGVLKYGAISGVKNYFAMVGKKGREAEEKVGYYGEQHPLKPIEKFYPADRKVLKDFLAECRDGSR